MKNYPEWNNVELWNLNPYLIDVDATRYDPSLPNDGYISGETILAKLKSYQKDWNLPQELVDASMRLKCNAFVSDTDDLWG